MYNPTSANSVTATIIHVSNYIIIHVKCTTVKLTVMYVHAVIIIPDLNANYVWYFYTGRSPVTYNLAAGNYHFQVVPQGCGRERRKLSVKFDIEE